MATGTPDSTSQVEARIKADVQRTAPDSNPYLRVHWLRSLIAGLARRQYDFYGDLRAAEERSFPDTKDPTSAIKWGGIYVGAPNASTQASGTIVALGTAGSMIGAATTLTAGSTQYTVTTGDTIAVVAISVASITRIGTTATVTTDTDHGLSSFVPVTITGADQPEYNVTDAEIIVTGADTFTYEVVGGPVTPATGTISAGATIATLEIQSVGFGESTNLVADSPLVFESPIAGVQDTAYAITGGIAGGTDTESTADFVTRYLDKIRNPVAHFNAADIIAKAKEITGVTRVFVVKAGDDIGTLTVASITRNGNVATVTTATPHGMEGGQLATINGADQPEYNVTDVRVLVENDFIFHYIVFGSPVSPATGGITTALKLALGQVQVYFMRDNDADPIPDAPEVAAVKALIDTIVPAVTPTANVLVAAPTAVPVDFIFGGISPDTPTMRAAVRANLQQFFAEETTLGTNVDEDKYRAAIINTVDVDTGESLQSFDLSAPVGDITILAGEIATLGVDNL